MQDSHQMQVLGGIRVGGRVGRGLSTSTCPPRTHHTHRRWRRAVWTPHGREGDGLRLVANHQLHAWENVGLVQALALGVFRDIDINDINHEAA